MANDISLAGKVAIVTGAGGALGSAMMKALSAAGAKIMGVDQYPRPMKDIGFALPGPDFAYVVADVTVPAAAEGAVAETVRRYGQVDILVNNAGVSHWMSRPEGSTGTFKFYEAVPEPYQRVLTINAIGPFLMSRAAARQMIPRKWGRIINVTTSFDTMMRPGMGAYGASKAALEASSNIWAGDLDGTGVTVNILVPGGLVFSGMMPADRPRTGPSLPADIMQPPIPWLASERSNGVTGCRFVAEDWDTSLPPDEAAAKCKAPIGWASYAAEEDARKKRLGR